MSSSSRDLLVTPDPRTPTHGTLTIAGKTYTCVLGRSGVRRDKHEGDGATPVGRFALRRVLYRADRIQKPQTVLSTASIAADDGWCDAPDDPAYNRPVKLPYRASAEVMARDDHLYDIVVVLGHNDDPVVPNAGSAIFLHVAPGNGEATAGCVALAADDLREVLESVSLDSAIAIEP